MPLASVARPADSQDKQSDGVLGLTMIGVCFEMMAVLSNRSLFIISAVIKCCQ